MANPNPPKPPKSRGRPKGSVNKVGREAKEVIAAAAEGLGGLERMITWAKSDPKNESAFWTSVYPKLLPLTVAGDKDNPLAVVGKFTLAPLE